MLQRDKIYVIKLDGEPHIVEVSSNVNHVMIYGSMFDGKVSVMLQNPDFIDSGCLMGIKMTNSGVLKRKDSKESYNAGNAFTFRVTDIKEVPRR